MEQRLDAKDTGRSNKPGGYMTNTTISLYYYINLYKGGGVISEVCFFLLGLVPSPLTAEFFLAPPVSLIVLRVGHPVVAVSFAIGNVQKDSIGFFREPVSFDWPKADF